MSARMNSTSVQKSVDASVTAGFSSNNGLQETWVQTDLSLHTRDLDLLELIYLLKTSNILEVRPVTGECPLCGYVKAPCKDVVPGYSMQKNGRQNLIEGFSNKPILNNGNNECWKQIQTMTKKTERAQLKTADLKKRRPEKEIHPADHHSAHENDSLTTDDNNVSIHSPKLAGLNKRKSEDVKSEMHNHPNVKHHCSQNLSKTLPVDSNKDVHISTARASSVHVRSRSQQHAVIPSTETSYAASSGPYYSDSHHFVHNAGIYSAISFEDNTNVLTWHKDRTLNSEETSCMSIGSHLASDDSSFQFLQYSPLNTDRVPMVSSGFYDNPVSLFPRSISQHEILPRQNTRSNEQMYEETNTRISKREDSKKLLSGAYELCDSSSLTCSEDDSKMDSCNSSGLQKFSSSSRERLSLDSYKVVSCNTENAKAEEGRERKQCQVCGDLSSGFYCGAFVCEACKKFYLRSLKQNSKKYSCLKKGECQVSKETRTVCQYCRFRKCIAIGMTKHGSSSGSEADISNIPCRVCGAPSSGFHFGAVTCEGCKGFFRRTVRERDNYYSCTKHQQCSITETTRNMCKYCRYKKCLSVGMKVDGSRIGRQPNAFKHAAMLELKQMHHAAGHQSLKPHSHLSPVPVSTTSLEQTTSVSLAPSTSSATTAVLDKEPKEGDVEPVAPKEDLASLLINKPQEGKKELVVLGDSPLEELVQVLSEAFEELKRLQKNELPVDLPDMGIDELWQLMMENFENCAKCVLSFAKKLPHFKELSIEDQICLVQNSIYQLVHTLLGTLYDSVSKEYCYFHFPKRIEQKILMLFPQFQPIVDHFHAAGSAIQLLNLNNEEMGFLTALQLFSTDEGEYENEKEINDIQEKISAGLYEYLFKRSPENSLQRYGLILLQLPVLRLISIQHQQIIKDMHKKREDIEFHPSPLYKEMFIENG